MLRKQNKNVTAEPVGEAEIDRHRGTKGHQEGKGEVE